jgi:pimeloyl-ACP methyl ester carboxylesterase
MLIDERRRRALMTSRERRKSTIDRMVRESRISVGERTMRYLEAGSGWPVVLLHAFPFSADMWRPELERVPEGWHFIAPDLRGFGPESAPASRATNPTLDGLASDVVDMLDALEIDRAVIGGLSMGGYVTFALFRRVPQRFTGMILADTRPQPDTPEGREGRRKMIDLAYARGAAAVADAMLPKLLGATTKGKRPALEPLVREMIEGQRVEGIVAALQAMMARPDSTPDLERIAVPALVIVGSEDELTPTSDAELMQNHIPRSRLVVLPEAGHLSSLEAPDGFTLAVADFLASNL